MLERFTANNRGAVIAISLRRGRESASHTPITNGRRLYFVIGRRAREAQRWGDQASGKWERIWVVLGAARLFEVGRDLDLVAGRDSVPGEPALVHLETELV